MESFFACEKKETKKRRMAMKILTSFIAIPVAP
jgi:hypothetical protein